ncbi:hypothetical protein [Streptomyces sp. NPDC094049]|uniref:hypothetical protein n=1 Tax=Streptomyces sp. NPDC094049 TaxID=3154987 RepID=UPI00332395E0
MTAVPPPAGPQEPPLLSAHSALVLMIALCFGTAIGVLAYFSTRSLAGAVLAGLPAFGLSVVALHKLIGR